MITHEHGNWLLHDDIVYIFNEFDISEDKQGKKLIEYINDETSVYSQKRIFNVTDGLRVALKDNKLTNQSFSKRVNTIYSTTEFGHKNYFKTFSNLKAKQDYFEIANKLLFTETILPQICGRKIKIDTGEKSILTINNFETEQKNSDKLNKLKDIISKKNVVIVDTVVPKFCINTLVDESSSIRYIGNQENYSQNINQFNEQGYDNQLKEIEDYSLDDYFKEVTEYIEAYIINDKLKSIITGNDIKENYKNVKELLSFQINQVHNLVNYQYSRVISLNVFPYLLAYLCENVDFFSGLLNILFKDFSENYVQNFFQNLKNWEQVLKECKITCIINEGIWKEINLVNHKQIDELFDFINGTDSYEFIGKNDINHLNRIIEISREDVKEYVISKIIEHILKSKKFVALSSIDESVCNYIDIIKKYSYIVINDLDEDINLKSIPDEVKKALIDFKNEYNNQNNTEWIYEDGIDLNNSIAVPFSLTFNKELLHKGKISQYGYIRPFISKNVVFILEKNKANVIDLFTKKESNYKFGSSENNFKTISYNEKLILSLNGELYSLDKNCTKKNLNIKINSNIYNGIRIKDNCVYYFADESTLSMVPVKDFIEGEGIFAEKTFKINNFSDENHKIIDLIIMDDKAIWINNKYLWNLNLNSLILERVELGEPPLKLFNNNNQVYILFKNSLYIYSEFKSTKWITDIQDWENFTCYKNNLILTKGKRIYFVELLKGKLQIFEENDVTSNLTDIISTNNRILTIDNDGNIYNISVTDDQIKKNKIHMHKLLEVEGQLGRIIYSNRHMVINCSKYFYIYSA
jgi:hypothetical protein